MKGIKMQFRIFKKDINLYKEALEKAGFNDVAKSFDNYFYGDKHNRVNVDLEGKITPAVLNVILNLAEKEKDNFVYLDARAAIEVLNNPKSKLVKSLKGFQSIFDTFVKKDLIDGWLYKIEYGSEYLPYLVSSCVHKPANPEYQRPAQIVIELKYTTPVEESSISKETITLTRDEVYGKSIVEILAKSGFFKENNELRKEYFKRLDGYDKYSPLIGSQFVGLSNALIDNGYNKYPASVKDHKLVNDQDFNTESKSIEQKTRVPFFSKFSKYFDFDDNAEDEIFENTKVEDIYQEVKIPYHPYLKMFDLKEHKKIWVVADNIRPYEYDTTIHDKLVLPESHRDLIDVLVNDADVVLEDIIKGKSGGTNILCKGAAGLGKTLTAEVYSEIVKKPVYSVHSGQLGTNPDDIDKRLETILNRASKWGAILLLDEADVYIRKRDNSMDHNAIVAAFLRKIERFEGIMFLTTNRSEDVDDAISSRCIAIIDYDYPEKEDLAKIWSVLSTNYDVSLNDEIIDHLVNTYSGITGRDVKEILKLARKFISQKAVKIDKELFRKCTMFRGIKQSK